MDKININLLPPEIKEKAKKQAKQVLINKISIGLLGILILTTSSILAVAIIQSSKVRVLILDIEQEKSMIQAKKDTEAVVGLLKNRLDVINQFTTERYKQREVFDLITTLFPAGITIQSLKIDRSTNVLVIGKSSETGSVQKFFNNLTDPKMNEGKITSVSVDNLNRGRNEQVNFELTIHLANGVL